MKYITAAVVSLFVAPFLVFAQTQSVLPNAGLTPENPFYFFDRFGETLQEFFTFNPEAKAHLQITFAAERVAEIKVILETKGIEAKGLEIAQSRLQKHLANAATIVTDQKAEGKDVSQLAKDLDNEFEAPKTALEQTFKDGKLALKAKEDELKAKIKETRRANDTTQIETLIKQLADTKVQKELLDQKENDNEETIDQEGDHIDEAMGLQQEAAEKIREADEKRTEVLQEAKEQNYVVPADVLSAFDGLLSKAKAAFEGGDYQEAARLAKEARKSIKDAKKSVEKLQNAKEEEDELEQEADEQRQGLEDKLKEADKEEAQKIREEIKRKDEKLKEEQAKVQDEQKQIREDLRGTVQQIQRASKMEGAPNANPSESAPKELKESNELLPGKELNTLKPTSNKQDSDNGERMEPAVPVEMQQLAPQQ